MDKIPFVDGTKISNAKVTVNEQEYEVTPAQYSGTTPVSAFNLNKMQDNIEKAIDTVERIDISSKATNKVTGVTRALVFKNGKVVTINIACGVNNITPSDNTIFNTDLRSTDSIELFCSDGTRPYRVVISADGKISFAGGYTISESKFMSITGTLII